MNHMVGLRNKSGQPPVLEHSAALDVIGSKSLPDCVNGPLQSFGAPDANAADRIIPAVMLPEQLHRLYGGVR